MIDLTATGRPYVSYSAFTAWLGCGKRFQLERLIEVPQAPAWWFPGGSAVHAATEESDRLRFEHEGT